MKTDIRYCSGTGNPPAARKIPAGPGSTGPVPIPSPGNEPCRILPAADRGSYQHPGLTVGGVDCRRGTKAPVSTKTGRDTIETG